MPDRSPHQRNSKKTKRSLFPCDAASLKGVTPRLSSHSSLTSHISTGLKHARTKTWDGETRNKTRKPSKPSKPRSKPRGVNLGTFTWFRWGEIKGTGISTPSKCSHRELSYDIGAVERRGQVPELPFPQVTLHPVKALEEHRKRKNHYPRPGTFSPCPCSEILSVVHGN